MKPSRVLLLAFAASALIATAVPLRDGQPLLRWDDLKRVPSRGLDPVIERASRAMPTARQVTSYRWRDANGQVHFGNTPPPPGVKFETVTVDPNDNTVPSFAPESK